MNRTIEPVLRASFAAALGCVTALLTGSQISAQPPTEPAAATDQASETPSVTKGQVLEWVDQLDAARASDRLAAEKALIDAGLDALPYLPEQKADFSIEAAERLERVHAALTKLKSKSQSSAIRIRLDQAATLGEALEVISRESQIEFQHSADPSLPIQGPATPLAFWHAVDLVLDQTDLDVNHYGGSRDTLQLIPRDKDRQSRVDSAAYSGVYRIEPTSVNSRRVFNHPQQSGLNLSMEITWQPGLTPIGLTIPVEQLSGRLSNGRAIKPQETEGTIDISANSELAFSEFYLPLQLPIDRPEKIESLRGTIESLLPGKRHQFELSVTEPGAKETVDSMTVRLEQVQPNGDLYEVRLAIDIENAGNALESHRQWIFQNPVHILDADGSRVDHLGYELYRKTDSSIGIGYLFDLQKLEGAKLIYESPTSVVKNKVNFVLQDIVLP
ncbi:hypothetical protein FYK55_25850 [Roseiconus nitratireducens]|uniref:Uncharacterized protein n=1 Tax=Roseiconus nitratireducens TaxID=2605748 RepID=A0A5M6CUD3_9BACT|nr:hypothetical protein [Roseiconus nitratireducens]KAA5538867.1 hypothetical protein FYK55_25850 [Roseiconus nitratireducens]